jgi:ribosomal protein L7Ae-like RNA K-turn-binding protein
MKYSIAGVPKLSKKSRIHLKIVFATREIGNQIKTGDLKILGAIVKKLVATADPGTRDLCTPGLKLSRPVLN